jgi:RHS repeat-associated protein
MGRIKTQWDCPPSGIARGFCYVISATYDDVGNITSLTYPDNRVVTSAYNAAGRFLRTDLASFGGTAFNFNYYAVPQSTAAASWGYWPTGTMNRGTYGNGVIETTGYNNRLQVSSIADSLSGTAFFSKTYGYADASGHNNGNILSIADALSATRNQTFTYDSLNRILTGSQADNIFNLTYSYDAWGNMKESGTSSFQPLFDVSNRMIPSGGCSPNLVPYCYDAAGELLMDNHNHVYAYDGEARIKTVDGNGAAYTYNPLGNRVRKDAGATSTEYFFFAGGAIAELDPTSGTWTDYIGYGKRIAKDTSNNGTGAQYYHGDHLSSARIMTDSAGVKISDCTFNPFGEQVICSPDNASNHYRFTGKERDQETGLDNFGKRYYGSALGRFITPDPLLNSGQPWNPQSWNRYAYVENNPLRYTDPTGLYKFGDCSGTSAQCLADEQRFRDSIAKAKEALNGLDPKSDQAKALKATLDKLGDEDDGNIKINFGDAGKTNGEPNLGRTIGNSITINYDEADKAARSFNLNASEKAALDAGVTTHEGTHAGGGPSILGFVGMRGEHAAYFTESATYQGLHNNDKPFQLWNNSWLTVDQDKFPVEKTREQAIQHVLHPDKVPAPVVPDAGGPK